VKASSEKSSAPAASVTNVAIASAKLPARNLSLKPSIYDLWCGPASNEPPHRNSKKNGPVHYEWHWLWEYGNGDLGNQGIHQMDIARWVLGEPELSPRVISLGGRVGYDDDGQTPNTQIVFHDYKAAPLISKCAGCLQAPILPRWIISRREHWRRCGCEGGSIVIPSYTKAIVYDEQGREVKTYEEGGNHFENFIQAVRSRKHTDLHCDIAEGTFRPRSVTPVIFLSPRQTADARRCPARTQGQQRPRRKFRSPGRTPWREQSGLHKTR